MKTALALVLVVGCGSKSTVAKEAPTAPPQPPPATRVAKPPRAAAPEGNIVTAEVLAMNGEAFGRPPVKFKSGHVTPRKPAPTKKTPTGFEVQFASHATITTPTVYNRAVIVSGGFKSKELYAYEASTGKPIWAVDLHDDGPSSPACEAETCVISTESCTLFALDAKTGKMKWSYWLGDPLTSAPTIAENRVFASYPAATANAPAEEMIIRADHNEPQTKYEAAKKRADYIDRKVQGASRHAKAAQDQDAANGFSGGAPAAANAGAAFETVGVGSVSSMQNFQGSRIVKLADRSVNTMGDEVIATDAETGKTLWKHKLQGDLKSQGGFLGTAPLAAGNSILFGTLDGKVLRLDPQTGKQLAAWPVGGHVRSQPVVDRGWIYVGTEDGKLVAIDTKDPTITGWPTWGGNPQRTGIAP
ncbi:MAG TPA: PQQ-binding-like beta-propeller repeat protein [Kofleriaceae bacterium]|nr:PQQ-binding-like beta-propeller repeat protein [Kofleriaceae bacterium]